MLCRPAVGAGTQRAGGGQRLCVHINTQKSHLNNVRASTIWNRFYLLCVAQITVLAACFPKQLQTHCAFCSLASCSECSALWQQPTFLPPLLRGLVDASALPWLCIHISCWFFWACCIQGLLTLWQVGCELCRGLPGLSFVCFVVCGSLPYPGCISSGGHPLNGSRYIQPGLRGCQILDEHPWWWKSMIINYVNDHKPHPSLPWCEGSCTIPPAGSSASGVSVQFYSVEMLLAANVDCSKTRTNCSVQMLLSLKVSLRSNASFQIQKEYCWDLLKCSI